MAIGRPAGVRQQATCGLSRNPLQYPTTHRQNSRYHASAYTEMKFWTNCCDLSQNRAKGGLLKTVVLKNLELILF